MKYKKSLSSILLIILICLSGCASSNDAPIVVADDISKNQDLEYCDPMEIKPSPMLQKNVSTELTAGKQIVTAVGSADYAYLMTLEEIAPRADAIVEAIVTGIDYTSFCGVPWTKITATTTEILHGSLTQDSSIDVYVYGGYMPLKEFIEYRHFEHHFSNLTPEEIENSVLYAPKENEDLPIEGEEYLFFLQESVSEMPEGSFQRLGQIFCTFHIEDDGVTYTHVPLIPQDAASYTVNAQSGTFIDSSETVTKNSLYAQINTLISVTE